MSDAQDRESIKAAAFAALLAGQSISSVAEQYNIPRGTVANWASKARHPERHPDSEDARIMKRERIGELILDNLEAMLETTKEMVNVVKDREWLTRYSPSEVAVLFGVISDKTYRILQALPDGTEEPGAEPSEEA